MQTPPSPHPLADEIAQLRALLRGLASDDESEQEEAAARSADVARVAAVLIRAVEAEHELERAATARAQSALAAIVAHTLDALDTLAQR